MRRHIYLTFFLFFFLRQPTRSTTHFLYNNHRNSKLFLERFGIQLEKEDEMKCAVAGANFLLQTISDEAFTFTEGRKDFIVNKEGINGKDELFPYLLVNIGSGVSIIKVDRDGFERVSGTNIGGGTFLGLCRLLTEHTDFDQMLACSADGDNRKVDMLVGDIYGGRDYSNIGLSSNTIASSFGRVVMDGGSLLHYNKADITLSLLRMISYNISHIATMTAVKHGLERIFFGGYFIRGHAYTMNTISFAVDYWSKGKLKALFLRHEGFLGALGAFLQDVQSRALGSTPLRGAWIEKFIRCSMPCQLISPPKNIIEHKCFKSYSRPEDNQFLDHGHCNKEGYLRKSVLVSETRDSIRVDSSSEQGMGSYFATHNVSCIHSKQSSGALFTTENVQDDDLLDSGQNQTLGKSGLRVGVLHLVPALRPFPLLSFPEQYEPNIISILESRDERDYWLETLRCLNPGLVERAVASVKQNNVVDDEEQDVHERGRAFCSAFSAHLDRLQEEPAAYGRVGLSELLEMREECLRGFGFEDIYLEVKQEENAAALAVLPDLLAELDDMDSSRRLLALIEGVLAGNIFDWGSQSCVELYRNGTILEIYRNARSSITRPWAVDCFDDFRKSLHGAKPICDRAARSEQGADDFFVASFVPRYRKALFFCDNSGADFVLGMIPFARELLKHGTDVCLVANSLPAINDITAGEMQDVVLRAAKQCETLARSLRNVDNQQLDRGEGRVGKLSMCASGSGSPCLDFRRISYDLCEAARDADLIVLEGMGRAVHTNWLATFRCDTLKLAMIKNSRLANRLFNGKIYDCVCKFEKIVSGQHRESDE